jgi:hypothetical protein
MLLNCNRWDNFGGNQGGAPCDKNEVSPQCQFLGFGFLKALGHSSDLNQGDVVSRPLTPQSARQ